MIELGKEYRLTNGWYARIYAIDCGGNFPVHGAYLNTRTDCWISQQWDYDGHCMTNSPTFNLVEVRPRHKRTVCINMYPGNGVSLHLSRELADASEFNRYACIEHTFDFAEGDGL